MNFLARKILSAELAKQDAKFIAPHFPAGAVTPQELRRIADACEKFPGCRIKLSAEIIIGGIKDEEQGQELRRTLGMPVSSVAGFCVRPVKACAGGYICGNNQQDSFFLGIKLDERFCGRKLPFKMIISVSGCARCCSEPHVRDIGIVASRKGYSVFVGGAAGARPRIGIKFAENLNEGEVLDTVARIIGVYEKKGRTPERLGAFIERVGLDKFKEEGGFQIHGKEEDHKDRQ